SSARADEDDARVTDGDERIRQARAALDDQRYEDAIRLVAPLVAEAPAKQRVQALEITAVSELILGRPSDARAPLAALYEMAPGFSLSDPSLPPRVTTEFDAEAVRPHARAVEVVIRPAPAASTSFEIRAGHGTARVTLACR